MMRETYDVYHDGKNLHTGIEVIVFDDHVETAPSGFTWAIGQAWGDVQQKLSHGGYRVILTKRG